MQRKITFRAWDKNQMRWIYFELFPNASTTPPIYRGSDFSDWQQFTGLLDKNGKEIYEGDIVSLGRNVSQRRVIGWWEDTAGWGYVYPTGEQYERFSHDRRGFFKHKLEVLGNLYQNPELLK